MYDDIADRMDKADKGVFYNRFHALKHRAKKASLPFGWVLFSDYLRDIAEQLGEIPDPACCVTKFKPEALDEGGIGFCKQSLMVERTRPRVNSVIRKQRAVLQQQRQAPAEGLLTTEQAVKMSRVSAQLVTLLQELDGDVESLVAIAYETADAVKDSINL